MITVNTDMMGIEDPTIDYRKPLIPAQVLQAILGIEWKYWKLILEVAAKRMTNCNYEILPTDTVEVLLNDKIARAVFKQMVSRDEVVCFTARGVQVIMQVVSLHLTYSLTDSIFSPSPKVIEKELKFQKRKHLRVIK